MSTTPMEQQARTDRTPSARGSPATRQGSGYVQHRLGRLIKVVRPTPIYQRPDPRAPVYWHVPARYYLMMQRQRGNWCGVLMQNGALGWLPRSAVQVTPYEVIYTLPRGVDPNYVTRLAMQYLGTRYRWGGNDPRTGIDCSGFVKLVYEQLGIRLPRRAREQALKGIPITRVEHLQPGDRLYFSIKGNSIDHTGIYIGDGYFIHSARSRGGVAIDHLSHPLYRKRLVAARR